MQAVGGKVGLLLQHIHGHTCAAMCQAGEVHSLTLCALLGPWDGQSCAWCGPQCLCIHGTTVLPSQEWLPATSVLSPFDVQQGLPPSFPCLLQVVAGFSFAARSPQEVTLQAGQPVVVLEPHDKKGNKEWSLVEVNGQRGYVPSSYLVTVPVQEPTGWSLPV